jgi:hypothetical protein
MDTAEPASPFTLKLDVEKALLEAESWAALLDELTDRPERHSAECLIQAQLLETIKRARALLYRLWSKEPDEDDKPAAAA